MANTGGANRIELESQILCAALRASWAATDTEGMVKSCQELYQLFPDLLPPPKAEEQMQPDNYYDLLQIECDVNPSMVLAAYFKAVKRFLRVHPDAKQDLRTYYKILNAGFILRKPRLRLSHDLIAARGQLIKEGTIPPDGTLDMVGGITEEATPERPAAQMVTTQPMTDVMPKIIELMKAAQIIGVAEVHALRNQMALYPNISVIDLILQAGYVTDAEIQSLQLAEDLLSQGKINIGQFCVAMYDERTRGIRMAESLQVRGWLSTEVSRYRDA
ncbi:MAG: hypothetical protein KIT34_15025 [Cyanobacteria bacterium TGS_CYA1]|nr:hypothetical protein [Cyanobacteria bacterium TGS_CYA1]